MPPTFRITNHKDDHILALRRLTARACAVRAKLSGHLHFHVDGGRSSRILPGLPASDCQQCTQLAWGPSAGLAVMPRPWQLCLAGCPHVPCKSCISQLSIIYFAGMCCIGSISLPALVLGMYYTYVHTQCMYIKHREPHTHTHTHTSLHTHTHTHTLYSWLVSISHLKVGYNYQLQRLAVACEQHQAAPIKVGYSTKQLLVWKKGFACPCAYLACMSSFWAMCMCVAPAAQQLPHYMRPPADKQLHVCVCMYSSCPTASPTHVHTYTPQLSNSFHITCASSWQPAPCSYAHALQLSNSFHVTYISQLANSSMCVCMLKLYVCVKVCVCMFVHAWPCQAHMHQSIRCMFPHICCPAIS